LDLATVQGARGRHPRVCIEVDLSKPLLGRYNIDNQIFHVEYESMKNIYFFVNCTTIEKIKPVINQV
ncbi:hypothetical protein LINPERPRIM_LOCUS23150, partial [Linum perenne]